MLDRKNILVTGGAGFIASHICDALIENNNVICVDNFITGQEENIDHLFEHPNFEFIRHDLIEPLDLTSFPELRRFRIESLGIQEVYHAACPTSPKEYNRLPIETLNANALGTKHMLEIALKSKAKVLHFSSDAIYGEPLEYEPFKEEYFGMVDPLGPRSAYNEGKRFSESMVINYARHYGLTVKIARIFNTYGPRMKVDDGRMLPDFIVNILQGKPIVIYGGPDDVTTFCYISDMVEALVALMDSPYSGSMNLGSDTPMKMIDVAKLAMELVETDVKIDFKFHIPYTHSQGIPDLSKAREELSWFPMVTPEVGFRKTIEYMKARMKMIEIKG